MANPFEILRNLGESLPADTPENQNEREKLLHELTNISLSLESQNNAVARISSQVIHELPPELRYTDATSADFHQSADRNCCL